MAMKKHFLQSYNMYTLSLGFLVLVFNYFKKASLQGTSQQFWCRLKTEVNFTTYNNGCKVNGGQVLTT